MAKYDIKYDIKKSSCKPLKKEKWLC